MHIPPYHRKTVWQRFFVGALIGGVIAYCIFAYMYNSMYEQMLEDNLELKSQVTEVKNQNEALLEEKEDWDKQNQKELTVESVEVTIANDKDLKLDHLIVHQMEEMIKDEVKQVIGQDLSIVSESDQLLTSTIENKEFAFEDFHYNFKVSRLTISQTVKITVEAKTGEQEMDSF